MVGPVSGANSFPCVTCVTEGGGDRGRVSGNQLLEMEQPPVQPSRPVTLWLGSLSAISFCCEANVKLV